MTGILTTQEGMTMQRNRITKMTQSCFATVRWVSWQLLLAAGVLFLAMDSMQAGEAGFLERVQSDTEWLSRYATRQIGTSAHRRLQDDLLARIEAIPGVQVWTQEFPVIVPVEEASSLEIGGDVLAGRHTIHPYWPDGARLNNTRGAGISGRLVYIKDASFSQMPAKGLQGQIAVMELSAQQMYRRAFDYGAAAVIFLESEDSGTVLSSNQSLYKPRYYIPAGELADALRAGQVKRGRIRSRASWQTVVARNIYAGVKPEGAAGVAPYVVVAPYDSMSKVMGIAPGADAALDAAVVLNVLRDEAADPSRPLLFAFVDAYHINQLGMRQLAAMLSAPLGERVRGAYALIDTSDLSSYQEAVDELRQFADADDGLAKLHSRRLTRHLRRLFKDAIGPEILRLSSLQGDVRLAARRDERENKPATRIAMLAGMWDAASWLLTWHRDELTEADIAEVEAVRAFVQEWRDVAGFDGEGIPDGPWAGFEEAKVQAARLLPHVSGPLQVRNRVLGAVHNAEATVAEEDQPVARALWNRMADRIIGQLEQQQQRIRFFEPLDQLRIEIAATFGFDAREATAASFLIGVDIADSGILLGVGGQCGYNRIEAVPRDFDRVLKRAVQRGDLWPGDDPQRASVNVDAIAGRAAGRGHLPRRALISAVGSSFGLPGVTWVTDDAPRRFPDSPLDRYDRMNWARIEPQLAATQRFLGWVFREAELPYTSTAGPSIMGQWRHGMGRIVDVSAGETVPRVPRSGLLVTLIGANRGDMDGIRNLEFALTGPDGTFRLPLLCGDVNTVLRNYNMAAFNVDRDGALIEGLSTSASMVTARLNTSFSLSARPGEQLPRAVTFESRELNGPSFFDARFMEPLVQGSLLDTLRGGAPKQSSFSIDQNGQMWGLVPREMRWQLILRAGAARVRMALLNSLADGRAQGLNERDTFLRGYAIEEALPSIPAHVAARDLVNLNAWRLADYRAAGITSEKVDAIRQVAGTALAGADAAMLSDDGEALQRAATIALSNEIRAYQAVKEIGLDVSRGAIFLMLMLVPFSVAMERLLFASARIGRQITAAVGIFAVMTTLLWSFHPAFKISAQPLIIVMAFTILAMSVIVIGMVLSRFKASVRELQSSLAEGSGAKMGRGGLIASAVFLGIANMRKRKVRTMLTGSTVVLVTFALLCFSSTSSYIDRRDFSLDNVAAANPSVLVRRPTLGPLSWTSLDVMHNLLGDRDIEIGERVWVTASQGSATWRMHAINPRTGQQAPLLGALGLPLLEDRLSGIDRVLPNWEDFVREGGCFVSSDTAALLGVEVGETIVLRGEDLVVRGIFDPIALEDDITLLDGQRIIPYDYGRQEQDWIDRDSQNVMEQEAASAAAMQPQGDDASLYIPAQDLIVISSEMARRMDGTLRSFGIICESPAQAEKIANDLSQSIAFPAYYSNASGGVNVLVSTPLIAMPPRNIAIPLVIAALIIFTTILNSVSERKGEIYVYTSLGLAPTHVGALFVAEALTYGLMGAVFGYIAGQGAATLFSAMGWMQGITLNYSGTAVIKTMLLVQFVVVLSAIVPAIMAGKIASPSTEMDWKVPAPVDGEIRDQLPFTVSQAAARGLIAFIYEYLEAHRDGVLGGFDVDQISLMKPGEDGCVAGLDVRLWLEPYDMGVRQSMRLRIEGHDDGACPIHVVIRHEAGAPRVWWRLNRPFFFDLRRQLLGWRKLSNERLLQYVKSAMEIS
jgi:hypothetical protein